MVENLIDRKGAAVVQIRPDEFLNLTIDGSLAAWEAFAEDETRTLDEYNSWALDGKITVGPFLKVREDTGDVISHEGRHRALALKRAGGDWFLAGVVLANERGYAVRGRGPDDVPRVLRGQFKHVYETPRAVFPLDKMREAVKLRDAERRGLKGPYRRRLARRRARTRPGTSSA